MSLKRPSSYSLWLMPRGEVRRRLARAIVDLSREYSTPAFEPHVTLAGNIAGPAEEVVAKTRELVRQIPPFTIRLTAADGLDEYFRCLFVRVAAPQPLKKANKAACKVFRLERQPAFMPHLSLLYGSLPANVKQEIIASLGRKFELEFKARSIHLYLIKGAPEAWRQVARFGLGL